MSFRMLVQLNEVCNAISCNDSGYCRRRTAEDCTHKGKRVKIYEILYKGLISPTAQYWLKQRLLSSLCAKIKFSVRWSFNLCVGSTRRFSCAPDWLLIFKVLLAKHPMMFKKSRRQTPRSTWFIIKLIGFRKKASVFPSPCAQYALCILRSPQNPHPLWMRRWHVASCRPMPSQWSSSFRFGIFVFGLHFYSPAERVCA